MTYSTDLIMEKEVYTCEQAKKMVDEFFIDNEISIEKEIKLDKVLTWHMTDHARDKKDIENPHHISCQECWEYYLDQKGKNCG